MEHMKVILQKDVKGVGRTGDILKVKKGFARNFLFPRQMALAATESKVKEWEHLQKVATIKKQKKVDDYRQILERVSEMSLEFLVEASEKSGKIFGSVTLVHIVEALGKKGVNLDRRDLRIENPIKTLGLHEVGVELGADLKATLKLEVKSRKSSDQDKGKGKGKDMDGNKNDDDNVELEASDATGGDADNAGSIAFTGDLDSDTDKDIDTTDTTDKDTGKDTDTTET